MTKDNINSNHYKTSEKRSEEIAAFDKLDDLLNDQEKEFLKDRNINCVMIDGGEIFKSVISDFIDKLGDEENGE